MAAKPEEDGSPFQGIPAAIYCDNGPISRSGVFRRVMEHLNKPRRDHEPSQRFSEDLPDVPGCVCPS